ncbi:MAG: phosphodiester glycosidase family protein [Syntrophomonadaceae bacterium]|nr:phosphodiester glycosidase family protein [Syntrophomonadaceae bacterium]
MKKLLIITLALLLSVTVIAGPAPAIPEGIPLPLEPEEPATEEPATETETLPEQGFEEAYPEAPGNDGESPHETDIVPEESVPPDAEPVIEPAEEHPPETHLTGSNGELFSEYHQQNAEGIFQNIHMVRFDMSNAAIVAEAVTAQERFGYTGSLADIVARYETEKPGRTVVAAINGGFFQPIYTDERTHIWNNLILERELIHLGDTGSTIGFDRLGNPYMQRLRIDTRAGVNGHWDRGNGFIVWGFNHVYDIPDSVAIFTSAYGEPIPANDFSKAVVIDNKVTELISDNTKTVDIPDNGFVVVTGDPKVLARFTVGDEIEYLTRWRVYETADNSYADTDWQYIESALGAGPLLLGQGQIVLDAAGEGFTESKLIDKPSSHRSFIGLDTEGRLTLGTATNMTLPELCQFLLDKGLMQAINLDGGQSSALYYDGGLIVPGIRGVTDAIIISIE